MLAVAAQGSAGADALVDALVRHLASHTGQRPAHDDITLLALQRQR